MLEVERYQSIEPKEGHWLRYSSKLRGRRMPGWSSPWPGLYEATAEPFMPIGACAVSECQFAAAADALHNARLNLRKEFGLELSGHAAPHRTLHRQSPTIAGADQAEAAQQPQEACA